MKFLNTSWILLKKSSPKKMSNSLNNTLHVVEPPSRAANPIQLESSQQGVQSNSMPSPEPIPYDKIMGKCGFFNMLPGELIKMILAWLTLPSIDEGHDYHHWSNHSCIDCKQPTRALKKRIKCVSAICRTFRRIALPAHFQHHQH